MSPAGDDKFNRKVLGAIIKRPGQSSQEIAQGIGMPHEPLCDALNDIRLRGYIEDDPRKILTGDNTVLDAQALTATDAGREWYTDPSLSARIRRLPAWVVALIVIASGAAMTLATDLPMAGVGTAGVVIALLGLLRQGKP